MLEPMNKYSGIQKLAHALLILLCTVMGSGVLAAAVVGKQQQAGTPAIKFIAEPTALQKVSTAIEAPKAEPEAAKAEGQLRLNLVSKGHQTSPAVALAGQTELPSAERMSPSKRRVVWMQVTAYCPCKKCCGRNAQGITASGKRVSYNGGKFVAADTKHFPFGTRLSIPGYHSGRPVEVIDTGSAIKGRKLDVYFPSHATAREWGVKMVPVTVHEKS